MEALLFKTNHRTTNFSKEETRKIKRDENIKRNKKARDLHIHNNRNIPDVLELTNESVSFSKSILKNEVSKKLVQVKKPSRIELLKQWRSQKMKQKITAEKSKKAPFVVKHIVYKDSKNNKTKASSKDDVELDKQGRKTVGEKKILDRSQRVLREQNSNIKNPNTVKATFQKQSYTEWKKSQPGKSTESMKRVNNQTGKNTKTVSKNNAKTVTETNTKCRPVTRSMQSNIKKINKKTNDKHPVIKSQKLTDKVVKEEIENNDENGINSEKEIFITDEERSCTLYKFENELCKEYHENEECSEQNAEEKKDTEEVEVTIETVPLMSKKTDFEPPEIFNTFKFNQKVIFESIQDFIPSNTNPADAKLFTTNIPEIIEKDASVNQEDVASVPLESKTPVMAFKERQGIMDRKTPSSTPKRLSMSAKRASLTPNPNNFLHKIEDPIAARTETPKSRRSLRLTKKEKSPDSELAESESVKHFTNLVANEEEKFKKSVAKWETILEDKTTPEEHHGNILAAIGQAHLFMRKRFNQFKELIELHKDKSAEKAAHASDLDGFWEMIYYQVEDVHKRFEELDKLKEKSWVVDEPEVKKVAVKKTVKIVKPKKPESKSKPTATNSKKSDFAKFKKQMMAKKKAQQADTAEFVEILAPSKSAEKNEQEVETSSTTTTAVPEIVESSSSATTITGACQQSSSCSNIPSATSPVRPVPVLSPVKGTVERVEPPLRPSVRRSTRRTPSKYSSLNFQNNDKKSEGVACKLFEAGAEDKENIAPQEQDFTKYLSKTITEVPVQRDLLTSFVTPSAQSPALSCDDVLEDLMVFASPLPATRLQTLEEKSVAAGASTTEELLLF